MTIHRENHEYYGLFEGCTSLESMEIPDSVTSIGIRAFNGTPLLENQTGIKYVDKWVIGCDKDVKTAKIKDGIQFIEDSSFKDCTNLESIEISDSVTSIRNSAFDGCTNLKNVKIGNGVTYIGRSAFYGCESIESIEIPDSVTSIDFFAFRNCVGLTKVTIKNPNCKINESLQCITISNGEKENKGYFNGTICGYENSSAQKYAEYFKYNFESIGESPIAITNNEFHPSVPTASAPITGGGGKTYYKPKSITEISQIPQTSTLKGDSNGDGKVNVRDCAFIASKIAQGKAKELPLSADYNGDGVVNVRDAAAIARDLSKGILK